MRTIRPDYIYILDYRSIESIPVETVRDWAYEKYEKQNARFALIDYRPEIASGKVDMGAHREQMRRYIFETGLDFYSIETFLFCPHDTSGSDKTEVMSCSHPLDVQVRLWRDDKFHGNKGTSFLGKQGPWMQVEKGGFCKSLNHKKKCWHSYPNPGLPLTIIWKTGFWTMTNRVYIVGDDRLKAVVASANVDYEHVPANRPSIGITQRIGEINYLALDGEILSTTKTSV